MRRNQIEAPVILRWSKQSARFNRNRDCKVIFFSGGKDSFLATVQIYLNSLENDDKLRLVLFTTFDKVTGRNALQNVDIEHISFLAKTMELDLVAVPLDRGDKSSNDHYIDQVKRGLQLLQETDHCRIEALVFGDLHLRHIRKWREEQFHDKLGYTLEFPLWDRPYSELMTLFRATGVRAFVCSVPEDSHGIKDIIMEKEFNDEFCQLLPPGVDTFGENGEFHTRLELDGNPLAKVASK